MLALVLHSVTGSSALHSPTDTSRAIPHCITGTNQWHTAQERVPSRYYVLHQVSYTLRFIKKNCTPILLNKCVEYQSIFVARQHANVCRVRYCYGKCVRPSVRHTPVLYLNECTYYRQTLSIICQGGRQFFLLTAVTKFRG